MPLTYTAITALARKKRIPELVDNFLKDHPVFGLMKERGGVVPYTDGGSTIFEPIIDALLANSQSYATYDTLTYDTTFPVTAAEYNIKHLVVPVIISHDEETLIHGDNALESAMKAKFKIAQMTFEELFAKQWYGDGTGNTSKDLTGLGALLSTSSTYGGIAPADFTNWGATIVTGTTAGTMEPISPARLISWWTQAIRGNDHPDVITCGRKVYSAIWNMIQGLVPARSPEVQKMASLGFEVLEWHGVPVVYDAFADADSSGNATAAPFPTSLVGLNTKYLKIRPTNAAQFTTTEWRQADTMVAMKSELLWDGNITCSNRQRQSVLEDIDTTGM